MYRKSLLYLILISSIIRLFIGLVLELGNDEVYYYTYAQHLQSSYFDHPPGIAFLIKIFTLNLYFDNAVFIRMGSVFCAALGTLLTYTIGLFIKDKRTGWIAALLYNTSIYCSIIAGTFILPDSPQIIFWLIALLLELIIINKLDSERSVPYLIWILFGIANGLCIMCKIHGLFIWAGFIVYIYLYRKDILSLTGLYLSFLLTLLIISPIFWWNFSNHFVTYNYHSSRVGVNHFELNAGSLLQSVLGQWAYNGPINVVITCIGIALCNVKNIMQRSYFRLLLLTGLPLIIVVTVMSIFNPVLPHWSGPGFLTLSFAGAIYINSFKNKGFKKINIVPSIMKWIIGFTIFLIISGLALVKFYPGTLGNKEVARLGENDFTLDMYGWRIFGEKFAEWYKSEIQSAHLDPGLKIVCNKWFPAAHIDFYVAPLVNSYVIGIGDINDLHHFAWLNEYKEKLKWGADVLCIIPSNYPVDISASYSTYFSSYKLLASFSQYRGGSVCRNFNIFLLKNYQKSKE